MATALLPLMTRPALNPRRAQLARLAIYHRLLATLGAHQADPGMAQGDFDALARATGLARRRVDSPHR